jgi:hypothetical protein
VTLLHYRIFGLSVASALELPELAPADAAAPDVAIRRAAIGLPAAAPGYSVTGDGTLLTVTGVGRFLIRDGREIVVERDSRAADRNVRLFLLGSAFGALLHQRGLLPLHANAIDVAGRGIAFAGHSGAGKSTMAAWFHDRGHTILADDVCVVTLDSAGKAVAWPGVPRLRLWREALEKSGRTVAGHRRSFDDLDKWDVPTAASAAARPLPLERIYVLARAEETAPAPLVRRLAGVEAVDALVANTYRGGYVRLAGLTGAHLARCLEIARAVPVFEARRAWGFDAFDRQAALLREHALAASAEA